MFSTIISLALLFTASIAAPTISMPLKHTITLPPGQVFINGSCLGLECNSNLVATNLTHTNTTTTSHTPMLPTPMRTPPTTSAYNSTCISCMVLTGIIKGEIDVINNTITNITQIIKEICEDFSDPRAKECELVVDSIQRISSLVDKGVNVTQICRDIGLCPNSTMSM
jgi:hypothetical protein